MANLENIAIKIHIQGIVQGVGFRPFVYKTALEYGINGSVLNDVSGVIIRAFGTSDSLQKFIAAIQENAPSLASIESIKSESFFTNDIPSSFSIEKSTRSGEPEIDIPLDTSPCQDCLQELFDINNRRYLHPFINCTQCGPRITILKKLPYDRENSAMGEFALCPVCEKEYNDPSDRRFHAQPICCHECGPKVYLLDKNGNRVNGNAVALAVNNLQNGAIVAIRGLGGFHLACKATQEMVDILRKRKRRPDKPFALMARDIQVIEKMCHVSSIERKELESLGRPIVLLRKRLESYSIPENIAPNLHYLGFMLPSSPLHYVLFQYCKEDFLIMTSGNVHGEPLCFENEQAFSQLNGIVDCFLTHNRSIYFSMDDSVVRFANTSKIILRRARGYVPFTFNWDVSLNGVVALGGIEKNTVALGQANKLHISPYLGNVKSPAVLDRANSVVKYYSDLYNLKSSVYVRDLHPDAQHMIPETNGSTTILAVQHHFAHAIACMAENNLKEKCISVCFDGTGYGLDGNSWGGEFLICDLDNFKRVGHFEYFPLIGGDACVKRPLRIAFGILYQLMKKECLKYFPSMEKTEQDNLSNLLESNLNLVKSSSVGRLFDAVSALLGFCVQSSFEGQPAMYLENQADLDSKEFYPITWKENDSGELILRSADIVKSCAEDHSMGLSPQVVAAKFQRTIALSSVLLVKELSERYNINKVCFTGGCFQNAALLDMCVQYAKDYRLDPFFHKTLPPSDESISLGQAIIGAKLSSL